MIIFTEKAFQIDGTTDVIIEDVLKVLFAHSKQSEGDSKISVPALMKKLNDRYNEALKASFDYTWKKMDSNGAYGVYGMNFKEGILLRTDMYSSLSSAIAQTANIVRAAIDKDNI